MSGQQMLGEFQTYILGQHTANGHKESNSPVAVLAREG